MTTEGYLNTTCLRHKTRLLIITIERGSENRTPFGAVCPPDLEILPYG